MYEQILFSSQKVIRKGIWNKSKLRWLALTVMDIITTPLQLAELIIGLPVILIRSKKKDLYLGIELVKYAENLVSTKILSKVAGH